MTRIHQFWPPPPAGWALGHAEVHVWSARLDLPPWYVRQLATTLSDDELARVELCPSEQKKSHVVVARGLLRTLLSSYIDAAPADIRFLYSARGKPALSSSGAAGSLQFNLAHSRGLVLYAVTSGCRIGVDVEWMCSSDKFERIAERFFSARERAMLSALPAVDRRAAFFNCWTRKEAYMKATGEGLARPLHSFSVSLVPGAPPQLLEMEGDAVEAARWSLYSLTPAANFAAALAVEGQAHRIMRWAWLRP